MRTLVAYSLAGLLVLGAAASASAHFVWVAIQTGADGHRAAQVYFSEAAEPGEPELIEKIAAVKAQWVPLAGAASELKLAKQADPAAWGAALPEKGAGGVVATIRYGVISRGPKTMLLNYYAKYLESDPTSVAKLGRAAALPLDVVPSPTADGWEFTVLWQGKPAVKSEVVIDAPGIDTAKLETNEAGVVKFPSAIQGLASIRARWIVEQPGELDGKAFQIESHYCTLALRGRAAPASARPVAEKPPVERGDKAKAAAAATAPQVIRAARDGRAIWHNFPGFKAKVALFAEGEQRTGTVAVSAGGSVELHVEGLKDPKPVTTMLRSLVGHRLSNSDGSDEVSFPDAGAEHPLGRLIKLDYDSQMASTYRVGGDVIRQVNREMGGGKFTISVLDVHRNAEGKYLPSVYTVSFWEKEGGLRSSTTVRETWTRVGSFDLPESHLAVTSGANQLDYTRVVFSQHELLEPAAATSAKEKP